MLLVVTHVMPHVMPHAMPHATTEVIDALIHGMLQEVTREMLLVVTAETREGIVERSEVIVGTSHAEMQGMSVARELRHASRSADAKRIVAERAEAREQERRRE